MEKQPQFIREFSKQDSSEERNKTAQEVREKRNEYFNRKAEQNKTQEQKRELVQELETLAKDIERYNDAGFLRKITDYFEIQKVKAELNAKRGIKNTLEEQLSEVEPGRSELDEARQIIKGFYDGEKKKWAEAVYSKEDIEESFDEEHLASLSLEDYALLLRRFPGEMVTHVTRQGIRDHASSIWHTAGMGSFADGFKDMAKEGYLRSAVGIALQEHSKEVAVAQFLRLNKCATREEALSMYKSQFEWNLASDNAFADSASVHVASEGVMDAMYGSERGNEIFIAFPSAYVASQLCYGGKGTLADGSRSEHNDKWIYTKDHKGIRLDVALVFIPADARVSRESGSRYELDENHYPLENQNLITSMQEIVDSPSFMDFANRAGEFLGTLTGDCMDKSTRLNQDQKEKLEILLEELRQGWGVADQRVQRAILNYAFLQDLKFNRDENIESLIKRSLSRSGDLFCEAKNSVTSKEYWQAYFMEHPDEQPSKVLY